MCFELWRQDDNGNRFLVGTYDNRPAAEKRLGELTRVQHKQMYWIEEQARGPGEEKIQGSQS